jgi:hypothetical protein
VIEVGYADDWLFARGPCGDLLASSSRHRLSSESFFVLFVMVCFLAEIVSITAGQNWGEPIGISVPAARVAAVAAAIVILESSLYAPSCLVSDQGWVMGSTLCNTALGSAYVATVCVVLAVVAPGLEITHACIGPAVALGAGLRTQDTVSTVVCVAFTIHTTVVLLLSKRLLVIAVLAVYTSILCLTVAPPSTSYIVPAVSSPFTLTLLLVLCLPSSAISVARVLHARVVWADRAETSRVTSGKLVQAVRLAAIPVRDDNAV